MDDLRLCQTNLECLAEGLCNTVDKLNTWTDISRFYAGNDGLSSASFMSQSALREFAHYTNLNDLSSQLVLNLTLAPLLAEGGVTYQSAESFIEIIFVCLFNHKMIISY